jgi:hypothetical protein
VNITAAGIVFVGPWIPLSSYNPYPPGSLTTTTYQQTYTPSIFVYGDNASNNVSVTFAYYGASRISPLATPLSLMTGAPANLNVWSKYSKYIVNNLHAVWGRIEITSNVGHTGNFYIGGSSVLASAPAFTATGSAPITHGVNTAVSMTTLSGNLVGLSGGDILLSDSGFWGFSVYMSWSVTQTSWTVDIFNVTTGGAVGGGGPVTFAGQFASWSCAALVQLNNPQSLLTLRLNPASSGTCSIVWGGTYLR